MYNEELPNLKKKISIADLTAVAANAVDVLNQVRDGILEPEPRKLAPTFTSTQIAAICGFDKKQFQHLTTKYKLPAGEKKENGHNKIFTLEDVYTWVKKLGNHFPKPEGKKGFTVCAANYKGGVAKTSTIVALAQALTLQGRRCLVIDVDPQGSATQLLGIAPDTEVELEHTILPYIYNQEKSLHYAIKKTYWENLEIIPACSALFGAEFYLPAQRRTDSSYEFWNILRNGIESISADYDVILLDTSPSLSYLTINALIAANGLIMPCPPDALDFASSTQFWTIFAELARDLPEVANTKVYDFIYVLLTKVKSDPFVPVVRDWINLAYMPHVLPMEIPDSTSARSSSAQLKTIYDLTKPDGSSEAYNRYKEPLDRLAKHIDEQIVYSWKN